METSDHRCTARAKGSVYAARIARRLGFRSEQLRQLQKAYNLCDHPLHAYLCGKALLNHNEYEKSEHYLSIAANANASSSEWVYRYAVVLERLKKYDQAISMLQYANELDPKNSEYRYRQGVCLAAKGEHEQAFEQFEAAIALNPRDRRPAERLRRSITQRIPLWRRIDAMEKALDANMASDALIVEYARSTFWMGKYGDTVAAYSDVASRMNLGSRDWYRYAVALEVIGRDADWQYGRAVELSDKSIVKRLGVNALHEVEKNYSFALNGFLASWSETNGSAEEAFRVGAVAEKLYRPELSLEWYRRSIQLDPRHAYRHYKLALMAERNYELDEAVAHYLLAADMEPNKGGYWLYRAGRCLQDKGCPNLAVEIMLESYGSRELIRDSRVMPRVNFASDASLSSIRGYLKDANLRLANESPALLSELGNRMLKLGEVSTAAWAFEEYIKRVEPRTARDVCRVGGALNEIGDLGSAIDVLKFGREYIDPDGIDVKAMTKNIHVRRATKYADYCRSLEVDESIVLYESYWGTSLSCHPLAIYRQFRNDSRSEGRIHVWVRQGAAAVPPDIEEDSNVVVVKYGSDKYLRYLATAGLLINNTSFVPYFTRREAQRYMNTWHGTPLKTLGRSVRASATEHANITRNLLQATHIIAPNKHTRNVLLNDFDLAGMVNAQIKVVGSPRLDPLSSSNESDVSMRNRLGISPDDTRPVVLYAPTWRGTNSSRELDIEELQRDLSALDSLDEFIVLFRGHHLTESQLKDSGLEARVVPHEIDTYKLLEMVDCLVTDYSSLLFDFLVTGRPVIAYVPDAAEYEATRGLYFPPSSVVRSIAHSRDELLQLVAASPRAVVDDLYLASVDKYCSFEDGHAAQRAIDFLLDVQEHAVELNSRPVVGFFASLLPNGITSALRDLLNAVPVNEARIVLFVEGNVRESSHIDAFIDSLTRPVQVITRSGESAFTIYERQAFAEFKRTRAFASTLHRTTLQHAFSRELKRLVGDSRFSGLVQFEGYASYWTALFSRAQSISAKSSIYLHNEMQHEVEQKYPYLREIFEWLIDYDCVATVSEAVAHENAKFFNSESFLSADQGVYWLRNVIDIDRVKALAEGPGPAKIPDSSLLILAAGRLSVEKNHMVLVEMMPYVLEQNPEAHLVILGDGPLRSSLEARIDTLELRSSVSLIGHVTNPYPYISIADVFVLPSLHEGQPVVLYEAIVLGTRFVAAPTPGVREVADQFGVATVEADPRCFASAVLDSSFGVPSGSVSVSSLNAEAVRRFRELFE